MNNSSCFNLLAWQLIFGLRNGVISFFLVLVCMEGASADDGDVTALIDRGQVAMTSGQLDAAIAHFDEVLSMPNVSVGIQAKIWNFKAVIYSRRGQLMNAHEALSWAVKLQPENDLAWENLADIYIALGLQAYGQVSVAVESARVQQNRTKLRQLLLGTSPTACNFDVAKAVETVEAWRNAWQFKNVEAYLAFYGEGFAPAGNLTISQWESSRRQRIDAARSIKIMLSNLVVQPLADSNRMQALFIEHLSTDGYHHKRSKKLELEQDAKCVWRIVSEAPQSKLNKI
jgi:tetratricopeptide (TPR) repeat protein